MLYNLVICLGVSIAKIISLFDRKMQKFFALRKGEMNRVAEFFKNRDKRVIWFHSASAGEFEQVKPVIDFLKENKKDIIIICSFFSPSGYEAGMKYDKTDFCFNLPIDKKVNVRKLLDTIKPSLIIYTKYDVWRNLTIGSSRRGIKMILLNGTLPEKSFRHRFPASLFFGSVYGRLFKIYAISETDAARFKKMLRNDCADNVIISGDTRFDRVKTVIENADLNKQIIEKNNGSTYLVAGSTYETSEKKLLEVLKQINEGEVSLKLILVPHEVNGINLNRIERLLTASGFKTKYFSQVEAPVSIGEDEVLVVDAYGVLALLYSEADFVFIGGSYKGSVHSVLEPAVFGKPVIAGPYIGNAYEALRLKDIGGLMICDDKGDLYKAIISLARDRNHRENISKKIVEFYSENTGATDFIIKDTEELL